MTEQSKTININNTKTPSGNRRGFYLMVFFFLALIFLSRHESVSTIDCTPDTLALKPDIIMLGAWWCPYCYQAKKYFQKNDINYCEYDMENTAIGKRLYEEHGSGGIPILLIGEYQLNGFSEQQVEKALTLLKAEGPTLNNPQ